MRAPAPGAASPVGWDKSYPLDPVEAVNNEVRTPLYKQNVSRTNSYNKYSGNYGPRGVGTSYGKRGMSLDRNKGRQSQLGYSQSMTRAHSQANLGNSSSEDSYTGSRPYSGMGYHSSGNIRSRKPSGGSVASNRHYNYQVANLQDLFSSLLCFYKNIFRYHRRSHHQDRGNPIRPCHRSGTTVDPCHQPTGDRRVCPGYQIPLPRVTPTMTQPTLHTHPSPQTIRQHSLWYLPILPVHHYQLSPRQAK